MSAQPVLASPAEAASLTAPPLRLRHLVPVAALVLGCALLYAGTVGASWVQNGLYAVPLSEVGSGAHDPKDLAFPPSSATALLGSLAVVATPLVSLVGVLFVGVDVVHSSREGRSRRQMAPGVAVLLLSAAVLLAVVCLGPLSAWWMD